MCTQTHSFVKIARRFECVPTAYSFLKNYVNLEILVYLELWLRSINFTMVYILCNVI